jgi:energy-coupling factor transport system permease protein
LHGLAVPVLEEALDRAISLAGSMDSRGYGRNSELAPRIRHVTNALLLTGLAGALVGSYFVVDPASDHRLGVIALVAGTLTAVVAMLLAGHRVRRTRYRRDPWGIPEWLTLACAAAVVGCYLLGHPNTGAATALHWPTLPLIPFIGTLLAAAVGVLTPATSGDR